MVRFFSGNRDSQKKNSAAVEAYKKNLNKDKNGMPEIKKTPAEEFQERMDERVMQMMKEYAEGTKKKNTGMLTGVKKDDGEEGVPRKVSANAKKMFEVLARQKMINDMKKQKKKELDWQREQKKIKAQAEYVKTQEMYQTELREKNLQEELRIQAEQSSSSHFWGN